MAIDYKSLRQIEQHKKLGDGGEASIYERDYLDGLVSFVSSIPFDSYRSPPPPLWNYFSLWFLRD